MRADAGGAADAHEHGVVVGECRVGVDVKVEPLLRATEHAEKQAPVPVGRLQQERAEDGSGGDLDDGDAPVLLVQPELGTIGNVAEGAHAHLGLMVDYLDPSDR